MIRLVFGILLLLSTVMVHGQSNFAGWVALNNMFRINKNFSIHLDVQARSTAQVEHLSTFIFRPGLNWHFRKNMFATAGYGYFDNRRVASGVAGYVAEHRIWQQLLINQPVGFVALQHRMRLEERFLGNYGLSNGEFTKGGNHFSFRFRYFARSVIPFSGAKTFRKGLFGAIQNEAFLNLNQNPYSNKKFFDQNRLYFAMGYRLSSKFDLEAGYMNQYIMGANNSFTNNHILQLATYLRL